jgi:hypothetical protein
MISFADADLIIKNKEIINRKNRKDFENNDIVLIIDVVLLYFHLINLLIQ